MRRSKRSMKSSTRRLVRGRIARDGMYEDTRNAISSQLMRYQDERAGLADIIDLLSMYPDARRRVVRALGALTAKTDP